jgi:hypothetical protein
VRTQSLGKIRERSVVKLLLLEFKMQRPDGSTLAARKDLVGRVTSASEDFWLESSVNRQEFGGKSRA